MPRPYTVACYYFPNYHVDARNEAAHGEGWTEWELVRRAEPRFPGHQQPRVPAWGYTDEADPAQMAQKIAAAADHGIDAFIFDWYWYDDGPYLQRGLDEGFLGAPNHDRLQFALMWANHDWVNIHPAKLHTPAHLQYPGTVMPATFDAICDHVIARYFAHPSYWRIDGCPYFSIYELGRFVENFGDLDAARAAVERFRARVRAAGFPDLHLNAVIWGLPILPGESTPRDPAALAQALGCASVTSYVWVHHVRMPDFPCTPYRDVMQAAIAHWQTAGAAPLPYYPNVTMGWDSSPRTVQSDRFLNAGYPFCPLMSGNTPAAFTDALREARAYLDQRPEDQRILTINAWNEWTEGSYLEPDTEYGMGYLEAIREVFG